MQVWDASGDWLEIPVREFEPGDDGLMDLDMNDLPPDLQELLLRDGVSSHMNSMSAISGPTSAGSTLPLPPGAMHPSTDWRLDFARLRQPETLATSLPAAMQRSALRIENEGQIVSQLNLSYSSAPPSRQAGSQFTPMARFSSLIARAVSVSLSSTGVGTGVDTRSSSHIRSEIRELEASMVASCSPSPPPPVNLQPPSGFPQHMEQPKYGETERIENMLKRTLQDDDVDSILRPTPINGAAFVSSGCAAFTLSPPRGLMNVGNTCFLNAAVQALAHCVPLVAFLLQGLFVMDLNEANPNGTGCVLTMVFVALLHEMFALRPTSRSGSASQFEDSDALPPIPPVDFILALAQFNPMLASGEMHDAQELLGWLLDALHEDLNRVGKKQGNCQAEPLNVAGDALESSEQERYAAEAWRNHLRANRSVIVDLFQGQLRSQLQCPCCSAVSVTFDPFLHLTLPLPADADIVSLADAVALFCREEALDGDNAWCCPGCGQRVAAMKKLDIWKLPPMLMIHLRRVEWIELPPSPRAQALGGWQPPIFTTRKLTTMVQFAETGVDLGPMVAGAATQKESLVYDLCAVVDHLGTGADEGHYTAICRRPEGWCLFNDSHVEVLPTGAPVVGPDNYVLILERASMPHAPEAIIEQRASKPQSWPHVVDVDWSFLAGTTSLDQEDC